MLRGVPVAVCRVARGEEKKISNQEACDITILPSPKTKNTIPRIESPKD